MRGPKPTFGDTIAAIRRDATRYEARGLRVLKEQGFLCTLSYRIRRLRRYGGWQYKLLIPLDLFVFIIQYILAPTMELPASCYIGPGLCLAHTLKTGFHNNAWIGSDCTIFHGITFGQRGPTPNHVPTLGDRITVFCDVRILGPVTLGNGVMVGANATLISKDPIKIGENATIGPCQLVTADVPARAPRGKNLRELQERAQASSSSSSAGESESDQAE